MIATYDAEGNPDVMMAAWGGQQEGNEEGFQPGSHKTTENIRLNKVFFTPQLCRCPHGGRERLLWHRRLPECVNALVC